MGIITDYGKNGLEIWKKIIAREFDSETIAKYYYQAKFSFDDFVINPDSFTDDEKEKITKEFITSINSIEVETLVEIIGSTEGLPEVRADNIPVFSDVVVGIITVPEFMKSRQDPIRGRDLGYSIYKCVSDTAADKYGENHGKLAAQLDLISSFKKGARYYLPNPLTEAYCKLEHEEKMNLMRKLCLRIPIVQQVVIAKDREQEIERHLRENLKPVTAKRSRKYIEDLIALALNE